MMAKVRETLCITTGEHRRTLFSNFLNHEYFRILLQTCESYEVSKVQSCDAEMLRFEPMVPLDLNATAEVASLRRAIVGAASVADHHRAVTGVISAYSTSIQTFTASQKKYLPRDSTHTFAARH